MPQAAKGLFFKVSYQTEAYLVPSWIDDERIQIPNKKPFLGTIIDPAGRTASRADYLWYDALKNRPAAALPDVEAEQNYDNRYKPRKNLIFKFEFPAACSAGCIQMLD